MSTFEDAHLCRRCSIKPRRCSKPTLEHLGEHLRRHAPCRSRPSFLHRYLCPLARGCLRQLYGVGSRCLGPYASMRRAGFAVADHRVRAEHCAPIPAAVTQRKNLAKGSKIGCGAFVDRSKKLIVHSYCKRSERFPSPAYTAQLGDDARRPDTKAPSYRAVRRISRT
jgi:hypothetical protein